MLVLTLCGYLAGYNIGKVAAALPFIRSDFDLTLFEAGTISSSYSVAAMFLASLIGLFVSRFGALLSVSLGLALAGIAGISGVTASNYLALLGGRVLEGIGYILLAVSIPVLIASIINDKHRPLAMGIWGTFIPGGVALSMLVSMMMQNHYVAQWRPLWWFGCAMMLVCVVLLVLFVLPVLRSVTRAKHNAVRASSLPPVWCQSVLERDPVLMAVIFSFYSMFFMTMVTYMPTVLAETSDFSVRYATKVSVFIVLCNILGNVLGGWLIGRGVRLKSILTVALMGACVFSSLFFVQQFAISVRVGFVLLACFIGGMVPASVFASVARFVPADKNGLLFGMLLQTLSAGQVAGPILMALLVEKMGGWQWGSLYFVALGFAAAVVLSRFQRALRKV